MPAAVEIPSRFKNSTTLASTTRPSTHSTHRDISWMNELMDSALSAAPHDGHEFRRATNSLIRRGFVNELHQLIVDMTNKAPPESKVEVQGLLECVEEWVKEEGRTEDGGAGGEGLWRKWDPEVFASAWYSYYAPTVTTTYYYRYF